MPISEKILFLPPNKILKAMFTRYKRKDRLNKTVSRQRKQLLKKNSKLVNTKSPNTEKTVIVED